jgi:GMC oxidoreductase
LSVEHEPLPQPNNRLTLSDKKDWLGINKPNIYYDVGDYVRRSAKEYTVPRLRQLAAELGATSFQLSPEFLDSDHIVGGCIMGNDPATAVVDADCRIGLVGSVLLLVIHTWPEAESKEGEPVGRIISARKATAPERKAYEEGNA